MVEKEVEWVQVRGGDVTWEGGGNRQGERGVMINMRLYRGNRTGRTYSASVVCNLEFIFLLPVSLCLDKVWRLAGMVLV